MNIDDFKRVFSMMGYECEIKTLPSSVIESKFDIALELRKPGKFGMLSLRLPWAENDKIKLSQIEKAIEAYEAKCGNMPEHRYTTEPIGKVQHICEFEPDKNGGLTVKFNPNFVAKAMGSDTVDEVFTHLLSEEVAKTTLSIGEYCRRDVQNAMRAYELSLTKCLHTPTSSNNSLQIKNVIFADPATIVFWEDGTKTVVKAQNEAYDPEKGLAMAISKKALGNKHDYFIVFKKWLKKVKG